MNSGKNILPAALTVAGSDSGGGAGIQADTLTFAAHGVYACTAIAALTAQNADEVAAVERVSAKFLKAQLDCVEKFYKPTAAKTGMLFSADLVESVADFFCEHREIRLVVDPVMISTSGAKLLADDAVEAMKKRLFALAEVLTPNLDEASFLLGGEIIDKKNLLSSARKLRDAFGTSVLLKGGHLGGDQLIDALVTKSGDEFTFENQRVKNVDTHGSGCTLSSAIAANLAKGESLHSACSAAKEYILKAMQNPLCVGGRKFINHFPNKK